MGIKTHMIREYVRQKGDLQGVLYVLEAINEQVQQQQKQIVELAKMLESQVDTMSNVVNGVHGMRGEMMKTLASKGLLDAGEEDGLDPNTLNIGKQ